MRQVDLEVEALAFAILAAAAALIVLAVFVTIWFRRWLVEESFRSLEGLESIDLRWHMPQ